MKICTKQRRNGIQWTLNTQLQDLDFADDLLSHSHQQMQEKTSELAAISSRVGFYLHKCKTKSLKVNGGTDEDVKAGIGKARGAFIQLNNIWSSKDHQQEITDLY